MNGLRLHLKRSQTLVLVLVLLLSLPQLAQAAPRAVDLPVVDYNITVSLDQAISTLSGKETVTWTNLGTAATSEMYLHLYPNAFREGSTFLKESGGMLRGDRMARDGYGEMSLLTLQSGGRALTWAYVQPDDGNANDRTLVRVELPEAVAPGQSVRLNMTFTVKLPQVFARMGKSGQFVLAGQWFPKIAAYEPAGVRGRTVDGWNTHQYHGNTEFYADFGRYQVTISVPLSHTVAATGQLASGPKEVNGQRQYVFIADQVHDFVWATDNDFVYRAAPVESADQPQVTVQLYLQPEHERLADQYFRAARETLTRLAEWVGPYPYPVLSLVCPTAGAGGAGGMEYPTLVTGWDGSMQDANSLNIVLVHEIIHQYFYGLVASNEFEEAWLDEGFTSYLEDKVMQDAYNSAIDPAAEASMVYLPESMVRNGWQYASPFSYQSNVYVRGKLLLHEIERRIGWPKMQAVLQEYFQQYSFAHPHTRDFQRVLGQVSGVDFDQFFADYVIGDGMQDLAVKQVKTTPREAGFSSVATITQPAVDNLTVQLVARYVDGSSQQFTLQIAEQSTEFAWEHPTALQSLEIDPEPYQVILDHDRVNNLYTVKENSRWSMFLSYFLHLISQWFGW